MNQDANAEIDEDVDPLWKANYASLTIRNIRKAKQDIQQNESRRKNKMLNKTEGNLDQGLITSKLPWELEEDNEDPKMQNKIMMNQKISDQMRVNTRLKNLMDLSPSKIKYKKLVEKYSHNIQTEESEKTKFFNKYLQDSYLKLKKDDGVYHKKVQKFVGSKVGLTNLLTLEQQKINRTIINKYKLGDDNNFNKQGNAVLNSSKRIKNYLMKLNKTDNDDKSEQDNKNKDGMIHIENWKAFLQDQVQNQDKIKSDDTVSLDHILEQNFKKMIKEMIAKKKFAIETMIDTSLGNKWQSANDDLLNKSQSQREMFNVVKSKTPFKDNLDEVVTPFHNKKSILFNKLNLNKVAMNGIAGKIKLGVK